MATHREVSSRLAAAGIDSADHDARALLRHAEQHDLPICAADFFPTAPKEGEAA